MTAVVIARRHQKSTPSTLTKEAGAENFVESLPSKDVCEFDVELGTLLLGLCTFQSITLVFVLT